MPKVARDLLKHIEDSEDECVIVEPKKKKKKKEKTKYDRGYYKVGPMHSFQYLFHSFSLTDVGKSPRKNKA